jgi:alpha-mannosidase
MLAGQNWSNKTTIADVFYDGIQIPSQIIKEDSNISLDWRKKIAFCAKLKPMSMNRFDLRLNLSDYISQINLEYGDRYIFENEEIRVVLNMKTGLIDSYFADNMEHLKLGGCMLEVFEDVADSWLMHTNKLDTSAGCFRLMSPNEAREFAGVENINFKPVNIIEDGNVFVEIEALFRYNNSFSRISYRFPKTGREIAVSVTLYFQEKDKMVRLVIPTNMEDADFFGQTAFGIEKLDSTGVESVSHRWLCASNQNHSLVLINNGVYGSSNKEGVIRQSLLRSSGYCVHPIENRSLFRQDRFLARADQGERSYQFWLCSQPESKWIAYAERASQIKNEPPYIVSAFPSGRGRVYNKLMEITETVRLDCFKRAKKGEGFIVHLFNPLSITQTATLRCPILDIHHIFDMEPYEVKCFLLSSKVIHEVDFLENPSV